MNKSGLIHAMLKRSNYLKKLNSAQKDSVNTQIAGLQFMYNEIESIKDGIKNNSFHKNEGLFSFCNNNITNTNSDILKTGTYEISTDSGNFSLSKSALIREFDFTQIIISTLLKRQQAIKDMANLSESDKMTEIKKLIQEERDIFTHPGIFAKEDIRNLAKGRYLIAAHMTKPHAFDSSFNPTKDLNRFVHLFFTNTKKQQILTSKDNNAISEYIGIITK